MNYDNVLKGLECCQKSSKTKCKDCPIGKTKNCNKFLMKSAHIAIISLMENIDSDKEKIIKEKDMYKDRFDILQDKIYRWHFGDLEYMLDEWKDKNEQ